jgi:hypothetical protein
MNVLLFFDNNLPLTPQTSPAEPKLYTFAVKVFFQHYIIRSVFDFDNFTDKCLTSACFSLNLERYLLTVADVIFHYRIRP